MLRGRPGDEQVLGADDVDGQVPKVMLVPPMTLDPVLVGAGGEGPALDAAADLDVARVEAELDWL